MGRAASTEVSSKFATFDFLREGIPSTDLPRTKMVLTLGLLYILHTGTLHTTFYSGRFLWLKHRGKAPDSLSHSHL